MISAGVGSAQGTDSYAVGVEAAQNALRTSTGEPSFILLFASITYDQELVNKGVSSVIEGVPVFGCSTAGEITEEGPSLAPSVVVMVVAADCIEFTLGVAENASQDLFDKSSELAQQLVDGLQTKPKLFTILPDGLTVTSSSVLRGITSIAGKNTPIIGGSAGDDGNYKQTFQYLNGKIFSDSVVAAAFSGDFSFSVGVRHGWNPIGLPKRVTKADGEVVHEIDGKPAIELYKEYLGEGILQELESQTLADIALSYPIGISHPDSDELLLRAPFFVDERGSITCGGEVPEGSEIRLMLGGREEALAAAEEAASYARKQLKGEPKFAIIFNSHVRDMLHGQREESRKEIMAIKKEIGDSVPMIGFYTYAEQAPLVGDGVDLENFPSSEFRNETVVILLFGE